MQGAVQVRTGTYRHFKGGKYYVIGLAEHTETLETMVIYVPLQETEKGSKHVLQARPLSSWEKPTPDGGKRFEYLTGGMDDGA